MQLLREEGTSWAVREKSGCVTVPISLLGEADSPRQAGVNAEHVRVLTGVENLPPILVHRHTMRVIDGMHRVQAALARGEDTIEVVFFDGDEAAAFVLAVELNGGHGLPLTLADRRTAAARIVQAYPEWSDRRIAAAAGISPKTAGAVRAQLSSEEIPQMRERLGLDGRVRRVAPRTVPARTTEPERVEARPARAKQPQPERQIDFGAVIYALRRDPSLRFNENGRTLLRMLDMHHLPAAGWSGIVGAVPAHCASVVAELARECAEAWLVFADELDEKSA
ncbi:ParB/RepB/Spo0J family partition protein [Lentzea sp. NEAU-D7]|uniref:ParB/RepB/Spo0J family partition protein n=1 Tax=Lentzea sp. NEAU-D7 TaxID=2994667 RepID=UPI00224B964E|nr:ParB/RepB/Spo0J family partition protein [Lentzea sp. NEAU-D7]MCX2952808.1 ParB/RepB/Spo0J family partition protein [Lentzea sp. NEAU-D7]